MRDGFLVARDSPDRHWAKNSIGPAGDDASSRSNASLCAPASFIVAVSKSRRKVQHLPASQHRLRSLLGPQAFRKKKEKAQGLILQIRGQVLGGKRPHHHAVSHFIPKYIRSDTKDTQQDPISTFYLTTTGEDLVNTSAESINSGDRTDRGCANFFLFGGGVGWGRYITGMREAFCESCSM